MYRIKLSTVKEIYSEFTLDQIESVVCQDTGGNCMVDVYSIGNGLCLCINEELISLWKEENWYNGDDIFSGQLSAKLLTPEEVITLYTPDGSWDVDNCEIIDDSEIKEYQVFWSDAYELKDGYTNTEKTNEFELFGNVRWTFEENEYGKIQNLELAQAFNYARICHELCIVRIK